MGALHGVARSAGGARLLLTPLPTRFLPADAVSIKGSLSVSFTPTHVLSPYHPFSLSSSSRSLSLSLTARLTLVVPVPVWFSLCHLVPLTS